MRPNGTVGPNHRTRRGFSSPVLQSFEKYRQVYAGFQRLNNAATIKRSLGNISTIAGKHAPRDYYAKRRLSIDELQGAFAFAGNTAGVEYRATIDERGRVEAYLYEMRSKTNARYEDVEDGFTQRRDNYDETTITLQQLAEQLKTLKRDLKRAGVL